MRLLLLLPLSALIACGSSDEAPAPIVADEDDTELRFDLGDVDLSRDLDGDLVERIVTEDGAIEMGLTDAVLFVRLSDETRKEVATEMDEETRDETGLGGQIARAVTRAVESGLATAAQVPLSEIRDLRYEDGRVVIEMAEGGRSPFEDSESDGDPLLEQFSEADAQRLADAFDRVK